MKRAQTPQLHGGIRARDQRRGVIAVMAALILSVLFAFVAFGVDTGRVVMTQTHMQNAADAASIAASQEIVAAIAAAGESGDIDADVNSIAVAQSREVAAKVAAANGVYIDPEKDVRFGKRVFNEDSGKWELRWDEEPYNTVQVSVRKDNPNLSAPDAQLRLAFGWAVGKDSMPLSVSAAAFIESRDMVLVMDFSGSMSDDSELRSISKLGQDAIEENLALIYEELETPDIGDLSWDPQYLTLPSPDPTEETQAKVHATFMYNRTHVTSTKPITNVKLKFSNGQTQNFGGLNISEGEFTGSGSNKNRDIVTVWVTSGMTGGGDYESVTLTGDAPTSNSDSQIWVTFTGTSVSVTSSKDLSNVVLEFSDGSHYKFDDLTGETGVFSGQDSDAGKFITRCWIKSGDNHSGDGPGYGECFVNPQEEGNSTLTEEVFQFDDTNDNVRAVFDLWNTAYPYPGGNGSWNDFINYCRYDSDPRRAGYREMYGGLTWVNYLLDRRLRHTDTPDLWKTSHYPFHAVKNGASLFCQFLDNLDFGDELGLVSYDTKSRVETGLDMPDAKVDLGDNLITPHFESIDTIQRHKQAGHYGSTTGMGYAIEDGRILLVGDDDAGLPAYKRDGSRLTMLVMTDGLANQYPSGWSLPSDFDWADWTDYDGDGDADYTTSSKAKQFAFYQATLAVEDRITLHTMSVGVNADTDLMDAIAFAGGGIHINVPGGSTIDEMQEQLLEAFAQIAAKVPPPKIVFDPAS